MLIAAGRVTVDGVVAELGRRVHPDEAHVEVDGVKVVTDTTTVVYLLHKPLGVVTTASDPQRRPTVVEMVPDEPRVFPVGRLDIDTAGLLILTNDGELAHVVAHPSHGVDKTYVAEVDGRPSPGGLRRLRSGVDLDEGRTAPARVRYLGTNAAGRSVLELTIHEGRNRQVRRMCDAVGLPVQRLTRTRIGPIADNDLAVGAWRELSAEDVRALLEAAAKRSRLVGHE